MVIGYEFKSAITILREGRISPVHLLSEDEYCELQDTVEFHLDSDLTHSLTVSFVDDIESFHLDIDNYLLVAKLVTTRILTKEELTEIKDFLESTYKENEEGFVFVDGEDDLLAFFSEDIEIEVVG